MNHNKYICIIEDLTDGQDEYTNLNDLKSDLNTDLGMIGLCVIDIKLYNEAPVSAPTFPDCNIGTAHECCVARMKRLEKEGYGVKWVAPVSAEPPTKCPTCGSREKWFRHAGCGTVTTNCQRCADLWHDVAAPSVASEDSATQPVPAMCPVCGSDDPKVRFRGRLGAMDVTCTHFWHNPKPSSEDWMRKAARGYMGEIPKIIGPGAERLIKRWVSEEDRLVGEIAKHFAASQLSTEKK